MSLPSCLGPGSSVLSPWSGCLCPVSLSSHHNSVALCTVAFVQSIFFFYSLLSVVFIHSPLPGPLLQGPVSLVWSSLSSHLCLFAPAQSPWSRLFCPVPFTCAPPPSLLSLVYSTQSPLSSLHWQIFSDRSPLSSLLSLVSSTKSLL